VTLRLAESSEFRRLSGVWWLLAEPAPLAGGGYPDRTLWAALKDAGIDYALQLHGRGYDCAPVELLDRILLEDLVRGEPPANPIEEWEKLRRAVVTVSARVKDGQGVFVHCLGGIGRTGTVLGCVLRELGVGPAEALTEIERRRSRLEAAWQRQVVKVWPHRPQDQTLR
jgi:hypothetical protein